MGDKTFNQDPLRSLSPASRALFNKLGRGETLKCPFSCIHHAFEFQARSYPDYSAVEDIHDNITYSQLDRRANCLATQLRELGIYPGSKVGLLVERSILMVIGILAVLKAGGAYVPLDGNVVSGSTLTHALRDSDAAIVLVQDKFSERVFATPTLSLDKYTCPHGSVVDCSKPEDMTKPDDSAYIIYTSGTTGIPKGVDVMHRNVTNLVCISPGNLAMSPGLRVSQFMNISFDMAAWEILGSLCNGSTLCLRGKTSTEWRMVMKSIDVMITTPSMLTPHDPSDYPNIKVVAVGGEPCPKALADLWAQSVDFYNCCGPTEVTIIHAMHRHSRDEAVFIGAPIPNNTVYILNEDMQPVKIGDVGILWAGGLGVTRGYLNSTSKTAEVYKIDPFLDDGSIMFNTGDLARWHPSGYLEHLGRVDDQVKVKGFRVELDGVAAAIETTPGVKFASVILVDGELWGFYAPPSVTIEAVKETTSRVQSYYAVPNKYIPLHKFPQTINGKVDKAALKKLALESSLYVSNSPSLQVITPKLNSSQPVSICGELCAQEQPSTSQTPNYSLGIISDIECHSVAGSVQRDSSVKSVSMSMPSPLPNDAPLVRQMPEPVFLPPAQAGYLAPLPRADEEEHYVISPSLYSPQPSEFQRRSTSEEYWNVPNHSAVSVQQLFSEVSRRSSPRSTPPPPVPSRIKSLPLMAAPQPGYWSPIILDNDGEKVKHIDEKKSCRLNYPSGHVEIVVNLPFENDVNISTLERQTSNEEGYRWGMSAKKDGGGILHALRQRYEAVRRLLPFGLVVFINILALIGTASRSANAFKVSEAVAANFFLAILIQQEYVLDTIYSFFTAVPTSWPLWVRMMAAGVHNVRGIHSGAGGSTFIWQLYYSIQVTKEAAKPQGTTLSGATVAFAYLLLFSLIILFVMIHARMHEILHSSFEALHRLLACCVLSLLTVQTFLVVNDYRPIGKPFGMELIMAPSFWLVLLMIVSFILPWLHVRKVGIVCSESISSQALRVYFDYATPPAGSLIRLSSEPLKQWHNFLALTEPDKPGFSIIINSDNELAKRQVANPAQKFWMRRIPNHGIMRIISIFRRIVLVATSSGIGDCIPIALEQKSSVRLLWISSNIRETFGDRIIDAVLNASPQAVVYDTNHNRKPNIVRLTYRLVKEFDAEAVVVMSNKKVTTKITVGLASRGITAFGALLKE